MLFYPGGAGSADEDNDMCADEPLQATGTCKGQEKERCSTSVWYDGLWTELCNQAVHTRAAQKESP